MYKLCLSVIAILVITLPTAFAELEETVGVNYNQILDTETNEIKWTSHPQRIADGFVMNSNGNSTLIWKDYVLNETDDKIFVYTDIVGSFIYDKNTCSYSIYESGYDAVNIIPSVSAMASYLQDDGTWGNLPVNDEQCVITIDESDGLLITSTKEISDDNKFITELKLNLHIGLKETFKVFYPENNELGITQTAHTPSIIVVGNNTISIADYNGQSFDRDFLVENKAEIITITNQLYYDFDKGFDNLDAVNIFFDDDSDTYKVNLDYSRGNSTKYFEDELVEEINPVTGVLETLPTPVEKESVTPFINYLEIDPTFGYASPDNYGRVTSGNVGGQSCTGGSHAYVNTGTGTPPVYPSGGVMQFYNGYSGWSAASGCNTAYWEYDVSSIPDNAIISDMNWRYVITNAWGNGASQYYFAATLKIGGTNGMGNSGDNNFSTMGASAVIGKMQPKYGGSYQFGKSSQDTSVAHSAWATDPNLTVNTFTADLLDESDQAKTDLIADLNPSSGTDDQFSIGVTAHSKGRQTHSEYWLSEYAVARPLSNGVTKAYFGATDLEVVYTLPPPPNAPTNGHIETQTHANQITIDWDAPASGTTPDGYRLDRSSNGGSTWSTVVSDSGNTITDILDSGVTANTAYLYRVYSLTGTDTSSSYTQTSATTTWNVPDQVGTVTGTSGPNPSLSWSAPSSDDAITNYKIYRGGALHDTISASPTTYSDSTSVVSGSTYAYTVSAVSAVGEGAQSASVNVVAGVPPDPPTGISATIANTATAPFDVVVTWSSPSTVGTGTLSNFEIFRDGVSQGTVGLVTTFANTVPSSGTYAYTVKAISNHGTSVASSADSITTASAPSQPTLTVTVLDDTSMKLDWSASNENGSTLQGYKIEYSLDNSSWSNYVSNTGNTAVTRTATSLNVDDQYYWKVSGINGVGAGTPSSTQNAWTLLTAPTNLSATSVSETQINLSWTGISNISSYTIQYETPTGNGFTNLATSVSSSDTTYSHTSLTTATQYNYRIYGVSSNSGSNSVASNEDSANTFGILPAPVLDTLTSVTVNPATVQLDWTASVGNPTATGYKIERNLGSGFVVVESDTASVSTTYTDSATTTMNEPIYRVSSINSYGTSDPSNELTLTITSSGGSGGGGGGSSGSSSSKQTTTIDDLLNVSILGNTHIMTVGEFITGKIPISWDSGDNLRISDVDYDDSILGSIKFNIEESTPIILQGSGNSFSSGDITYTISTPNDICNNNIRNNCLVETIYELPVTVTSVSNGDSISQTTLITIDTSAGFGGQTLALLSIFIMAIIAGVGIIKFARKSGGKRKSVKSSNGKKKARKSIK